MLLTPRHKTPGALKDTDFPNISQYSFLVPTIWAGA